MNQRKQILVITFLIVTFALVRDSLSNGICSVDTQDEIYLKNNFDSLLKDNEIGFYKIYRNIESCAIGCRSSKGVAAFLDFAKYIKGVDLGEDFAETNEKLLLANPKCYLDGAVLLSDEAMKELVRLYLKSPLLHTDEEVSRALSQYRNISTYKRLMDLYFKNN